MPFNRPLSALAALICVAALLPFSLAAHASEETPKTHCRYSHFATFPVTSSNGHVLLDGSINGNAATMLVDTGADWTSLTRHEAEKLNLKLAHVGMSALGVGGESAMYQTMVDDITLGKLHWHRVKMTVLWDSDGLKSFDALIGANILFFSDLEIDLAKGEIKFFEPKDCRDTFLGYWDEQAVVIPMREMAPDDQRQIFDVKINGKKIRAMIDSGAPTSVVNLEAAAKAGVTPQSSGVVEIGTGGGVGKHTVKIWRARFADFTVGEETVQNPSIQVQDLYGSTLSDSNNIATNAMVHDQPDMLLGADFLRAHRVLFAVSQRRLYLSYLGGKVFGDDDAPSAATQADAR